MKRVALAVCLLATPVWAQQPEPPIRAMAQMIQEAQGREAQALMRAYAAEAKVAEMEAKARPTTPPVEPSK